MNTTSIKTYKPKTEGLSGSTIKLIALLCMIIDHTGVAIVSLIPGASDPESVIYALYWIMRIIGRCAFPIYCFLLIEGLKHTKSNLKYAIRLFLFSLISEIPFDIALFGKVFDWSHQNVFWTLLFGLFMLWGFEFINHNGTSPIPPIILKAGAIVFPATYFTYRTVFYIHRYTLIGIKDIILYVIVAIVWIYLLFSTISRYASKNGETKALNLCANLVLLVAVMYLCDVLHTDYSSSGILAIAFMYIYRNNTFNQMISGCIVLTALSNPVEMAAFVTVPVVQKYNGKRGLKLKYFFYLAYPVHLVILYIIAVLAGLRILTPLVL